ncbi:MAG: adenosylcobalamin-dependent ribonucleoside-diphosphate reductase, partial [Candidatus Heimdallarchaeota archaeon]|nr:adenosylcobalamin-dependent ribonucleoside-diphosphate reductase [Candidatus Heimdallarchaeota archaeon]
MKKIHVIKRKGSKQVFDKEKIKNSIVAAGKDTGEYGKKIAENISTRVLKEINSLKRGSSIAVDEIRNVVEPEIARAGYFSTAKYYILYGLEKSSEVESDKFRIIEPELTDVSYQVMKKRYLRTNLKGEVSETTGQMLWRVAKHIAKPEINWSDNGIVEKTAREFYERMVNFRFVCAGKAMFEAGNPGGTGQLSSCFVLPIEDSISSIFRTLGDAAVVHKNNGGTGFNFSKIRPHGDKVKNVPGAASGPVDFLRAFSAALSQILQGAKRQGANIAILNVDHPDIEEFINLKSEDGTIKNFNISVGVTDAFMEAVDKNEDWELVSPRNGRVWKKMKARKLFELIAKQAWATGDPGLAFLDRLQVDNPTPTLGVLDATNPCGEIPLLPYESCNLTSICLNNHLKKNGQREWEIDWDELEKSVELGIRFLDNMIEANNYPLEEIRQMVKDGNRRIGLGVMGFAHLLFKMGVAYDSNEAVRLSDRIAKFMRKKAEETSLELAKKRGTFPNFDISIYAGSAEQYRNCAVMMIAPTGTTSLIANTSSGIEPVFSLVTVRRSFNEDDRKNTPTKEFRIIDPVFEVYLNNNFEKNVREKIIKQILKDGHCGGVKEMKKKDKKRFTTTHRIAPEWHVKIQAAWQKWIDNSVSKTINFP